jgi:hypothetical protein
MRFWKDLGKTIPCKDGDRCAVMENAYGPDAVQPAVSLRPRFVDKGLAFHVDENYMTSNTEDTQ